MDVIATWLLALTKNKIPINVRGDPIKSLLYMPGGHSMTIIFRINMLGGPIKSPINMPSGHQKYESVGTGSGSMALAVGATRGIYSSIDPYFIPRTDRPCAENFRY